MSLWTRYSTHCLDLAINISMVIKDAYSVFHDIKIQMAELCAASNCEKALGDSTLCCGCHGSICSERSVFSFMIVFQVNHAA